MADFDDFGLGSNVGGVLPQYRQSVPTNVRTSRPFMSPGSPLPRFYYDFQAQARHHALRRLRSDPQGQ